MSDTERADIAHETAELATGPDFGNAELAQLLTCAYQNRHIE
jgi:hypothetical protein